MSIQFTKAARKQAKLRLAISGPAGSGKTYSALEIAFGLGGKIAVIDTEHGSADLYAHLGDYDTATLQPPFRVEDYIEAVHAAEAAGYDVIIIDSLTHAWAGEGGLLDRKEKAAEASGNSYTAWNKVTPLHFKLVEVMLQSSSHIIATMRSKTAYVIDSSEGKAKPVKVGMAPVQRDGMEYEFTVVFDMNANHTASVAKDRTEMFSDDYFTPSRATGGQLKAWLNSGAAFLPQPPRAASTPAPKPAAVPQQAQDPAMEAGVNFGGHLNDMNHCFVCGTTIDPTREGMVSHRDFGKYLCLEHLKAEQKREAASNPAPKPAAHPAAPKAVAEAQRDQPSTSPLASTIAEINAEQERIDKQPAKKAPLPPLCAGCGKSVSANEMSASLKVCPETLCSECLSLMQDDDSQKPAAI